VGLAAEINKTVKNCQNVLALLPDAYLATKIPDMSRKNLMDGNPKLIHVVTATVLIRYFGPAVILLI